jgi:hypothetical protein
MSDTFINGFIAHLIADWLLQNHWMANNKSDLRHPAAWTHGAIHFVAMLCVFSLPISIAIAASHMLIDTRRPLIWWRRVYRQTTIEMHDHAGWHVAIWGDQVVHIVTLYIATWMMK